MTSRHLYSRIATPVLLSLTILNGIASAQAPAVTSITSLAVAGDVSKPLSLNASDSKALPRKRVEVKAEDGTMHVYEGVLVAEILNRAGAPLGAELRGGALASCVLASAADGYKAVFSLAELDPAFTNSDVMVADTVDGKPLPDSQGPWWIVAPKDIRPSRSVRMLQRLELVRLQK